MSELPTVSPYLTIDGAANAIEFYKKVFGAELLSQMTEDDGDRIMHATLKIRNSIVMLSDQFPEHGNYLGPDKERGSPVAISLRFDRAGDVDRTYAAALENGAKKSWAPEDMFWGDRFAQLVDPAGHRWMLVAKL